MTKGNNSVDKKHYQTAADHYQSAVKAKKTKKATESKKQATNFAKVSNYMDKLEFSDAKKALRTIKNQDNGNKTMVKRSKSLIKKVDKIQTNRSNYKLDIKNAKTLIDAGTNDQAKSLLEQVTTAKGIKGKYYVDLYKKANKLLKSIPSTNTAIKADNQTTTDNNTNNTDTNTNNADTNTTDTTTDNNSSTDDQSNNPAANGDFDVEKKEVNGKKITDQDIANARQQLTDQGVKTVGAWSDNDIIRAIKNAAADGRTTIEPSDAKVRQ